ncbi:membrane protein [Rhodospirillales bacterium TMPK1]|uniref:Membrane protein n=2 Tax=Roseiterribacter gracilis TaxID=2812848 RepID=A0A8S8XAT9_9PROT|nr:membrane protein [Rhodospirillales bacterium TMPK1]
MWATLAWLTTSLTRLPAFELLAIGFGLGAVALIIVRLASGGDLRVLRRVPLRAWLLGIGGLFFYHLFYVLAFRAAPAAQVNLLNYLWPLLIVLFASLLPGHRLRARQVLGALAGLAGAVLLVAPSSDGATDGAPIGYVLALAAAVTWAGYSVLSRRIADVPSDAVIGCCAATALLAALCHVATEATVVPSAGEWLRLVAIGLLPLGLAFVAWDYGCKRGDITMLGSLAYATPLLSTFILVAAGTALASSKLWIASALIVGGAFVASLNQQR